MSLDESLVLFSVWYEIQRTVLCEPSAEHVYDSVAYPRTMQSSMISASTSLRLLLPSKSNRANTLSIWRKIKRGARAGIDIDRWTGGESGAKAFPRQEIARYRRVQRFAAVTAVFWLNVSSPHCA